MASRHLSIHAKNVKIIAMKGLVNFRIPVANEAEPPWFQELAHGAVTILKVDSQLVVRSPCTWP